MEKDLQDVFVNMQKESNKKAKRKDIIIVILIVFLFLEPIAFYTGFLWYESQFDYIETATEEKTVDLDTSGDNANAEYNEVNGNQYNGNATHNESGVNE